MLCKMDLREGRLVAKKRVILVLLLRPLAQILTS